MIVESNASEIETIEKIKDIIKAELKLRSDVEIVSAGAIPNDGIVIEDKRTYE